MSKIAPLALAAAVLLAGMWLPEAVFGEEISIRVSPTSIMDQVRDGSLLGPILVTNPGRAPIDVEAIVWDGGHDENGTPAFRSQADLRPGRVVVTAEPSRFRLVQGASRAVRLKVHVPPGFSGGAYPIVVFRAGSLAEESKGQLQACPEVAVLTLLTVPPRQEGAIFEARPKLISVAIEPGLSGRSIEVRATCENRGNVHANLGGMAVIRGHDGHVAAKVALSHAVCLPGSRRTIAGSLDHQFLKSGTYTAEINMLSSGEQMASVPMAFKVVEGSTMASVRMDFPPAAADAQSLAGNATPAPKISRLTVPSIVGEYGLPLEVSLENPGKSDLEPIGYLEIWDYRMTRVGLLALDGGRIPPGGSSVLRLIWPEALLPGRYTVRATLQWGNERRSASAAFVVVSGQAGHGG